MRILHVISSLDRRAGGPPVALAGLALAQAKLGAKVSVVATYGGEFDRALAHELVAAGIAVQLVGPANGKFQRHPQLVNILCERIAAADVVHIHTLWEEIQHQAATIARQLRKPYVFTPHGMLDPWSLSQNKWVKRAVLAWRVRRDLNGAAFLHVLNADEAKLIEPLKLASPPLVIPNGVDAEQFANLPAAGTFRAKHGIAAETPIVLFLSRLHPKKGLDYLADSFALVARQRPDALLVVAGPADGAEKDFDARIAAAGLTARVRRLGPLYGDDKLAAFVDATVFVLPSRQEGFSVAIVEALACGTPVVISEACHFPEVGSRGAGAVVPLETASIAQGILSFLNQPSLREGASGRARGLGLAYTWREIAARTFSLYGRPSLAIFANAMTPYRIALHERIVREIPSHKLFSLFSDAQSNAPWELNPPASIGPVSFVSIAGAWKRGGGVIDWIRRNHPAAIIVNGYNDLSRLRVLRWCRRQGVPAYLWGDSNIRGDRASGLKGKVKSLLVGWAIKQSAGVMPCGSLGQAYFEKYGASANQSFWMPYEPDYEMIRTLPAEAIAAVQQRFNLPAGRRRIVYSGRLIPIKRVDLLLRAFHLIAAERPDWDLVIAGDGPSRPDLEAMVPPALQSRVTWTGFLSDQQDVSAIYRLCDVLVHVPEVEPWALVINEAAAAGLAMIATDVVGAAAELLRDGVNGRVIPPGDAELLRKALLDVTDPLAIDRYKAGSADVLAAWRQRGDPVAGVRAMLAHAKGLSV